MAYLLDSNLLIYSATAANAFLRPLVLDAANFASAISKVETLGFHKLDPIDEAYFNSLFALLNTIAVTQPIIDRATSLRQQKRMTLGDSLIAATALEYGLDIATRNVNDFASIMGLAVYNPFEQ
jgi:predicted nucleic acid-binding protein